MTVITFQRVVRNMTIIARRATYVAIFHAQGEKGTLSLCRAFEKSGGRGRVVQLGDLGSGKEAPGTRKW